MHARRLVLAFSTLVVTSACSSDTPDSGGMAGTTSASGSAGMPATGGSAGAAAGGSSGGGTAGGSASVAGGGTGGGTGGAATAGSAGMSGGGGAGGSGHVPIKSAGCGKASPAEGSQTIQTGGESAMYNINLPDNYEANTPLPLGLGFHGFGNGACGPEQGECRGFAMLPAVTVYMKSIGEGWEQSEVLEKNVTYFQDVVAHMKAEYCIDESRIFIAGVSSGGQFIEHLTCRFGDTLWQVTPVSASVVGGASQNCKGTPPILVIHGVTDKAGNYGQGVAEMFAERNGCSAMLPAALEQNKSDMMAAFNAKADEHRCMDWDGCSKNPVRFCISSQITYDGLTHGWPKIGGQLIGEFQAGLK
jgi:polyhydroxybutyrate depolymerase